MNINNASSLDHRNLREDEFWRSIPGFRQFSAAEFQTHTFQAQHSVTNIRQLRETLGNVASESFYADVEAGIQRAPMA